VLFTTTLLQYRQHDCYDVHLSFALPPTPTHTAHTLRYLPHTFTFTRSFLHFALQPSRPIVFCRPFWFPHTVPRGYLPGYLPTVYLAAPPPLTRLPRIQLLPRPYTPTATAFSSRSPAAPACADGRWAGCWQLPLRLYAGWRAFHTFGPPPTTHLLHRFCPLPGLPTGGTFSHYPPPSSAMPSLPATCPHTPGHRFCQSRTGRHHAAPHI